ncbi:MAG: DUF3786 domain-containing protein [Desulfobacterales bacterium]|nr:DUF3786 domain-containing protein [Desulfobacterales bacterium]
MPTGACGINCDVCRLNLMGVCASCGPGTGPEAAAKIEVQLNLFGVACPKLTCARDKAIRYCLRDCRTFPCEKFKDGSYPFSEGFLNMQTRRRTEKPPAQTPTGNIITVPMEYWDELGEKDIDALCVDALATPHPPDGLRVRFLNDEVLVNIKDRSIRRVNKQSWEDVDRSMLELLILVYLLNAKPIPLDRDMIAVQELKGAQFFQGPHELKTIPLLRRYGKDAPGFKAAAENLGGKPLAMADAAYSLHPFPRVPLYYLLWAFDEEFGPSLSILFDRTIERHLAADAIWGLVNVVSDMLL